MQLAVQLGLQLGLQLAVQLDVQLAVQLAGLEPPHSVVLARKVLTQLDIAASKLDTLQQLPKVRTGTKMGLTRS